MKRIISLVLCVIFMLMGTYAFSENSTANNSNLFDNTQFEGLPGYEYKKIDKKYRYEAQNLINYNNGSFQWGLVAEGEKNTAGKIWMYFLHHVNNEYQIADKVQILINDDLYTFSNLAKSDTYSTLALGNIGMEMIHSLTEANEFAMRVYFGNYYSDKEPSITDIQNTIDWAKKIVSSGYIVQMDKTNFNYYDTLFAASKE